MNREDFEDIVHKDKVVYKKKKEKFVEGLGDIVIEFQKAPYDILIEKLSGKLSSDQTETYTDRIYIRYKDSGDTWSLGYTEFNLDFWKFLEGIFYNYRPEIYSVQDGKLEKVEKGDLLRGVKFFRSELDEYIE